MDEGSSNEIGQFILGLTAGIALGIGGIFLLFGLVAGSVGPMIIGGAILLFIYIIWKSRKDEKNKKQNALIRALQIDHVDNLSGEDFEHYVAHILLNEGYNAKVTKYSGDMGADILATRQGIKYTIQTKRQASNVNRKAVSDAVAPLCQDSCRLY